MQADDGDGINRVMESLQDEVRYGKVFYFVWADGLNSKLEDGNRTISSEALLNIDRMKVNNNNNYASNISQTLGHYWQQIQMEITYTLLLHMVYKVIIMM